MEMQTNGTNYTVPLITQTYTFSSDFYTRMQQLDNFCKLMTERNALKERIRQTEEKKINDEPLDLFSDWDIFDNI